MKGQVSLGGNGVGGEGENRIENSYRNNGGEVRECVVPLLKVVIPQHQMMRDREGMNEYGISNVGCLQGEAVQRNTAREREGSVVQNAGDIPPAQSWSQNAVWQSFRPVRAEEDALRGVVQSEGMRVSRRRVRPTEGILLQQEKLIEDKLSAVDAHFTDCGTHSQRRGRKGGLREQMGVNESCLWIYHEYFYSNHDRMYFSQEDDGMRRILFELNLNPQRTTYRDYQFIHDMLPAPRLFSLDFIYEERRRLSEFRASVRTHSKAKLKNEDFELAVGREVFAVHPNCGHIHSGSILAQYKDSIYMVKFNHADLGTKPISDAYIYTKEHSLTNGCIVDRLQHESMALAIQLLVYKSELIEQLKEYNALAVMYKDQNTPLSNQFLQEYGWIGSTIKILSLGMKHIIARFRIRGLDSKNSEKIGKNYGTMLIHPLVNIGKTLIKPQEQRASSKINHIVASHRQRKVDEMIKHFNHMWTEEKKQIYEENQMEITKLVQTCIEILVTLHYEPKSLQDNAFMNIIQTIDCKSPEHVNEIYDRINAIISKVSDK